MKPEQNGNVSRDLELSSPESISGESKEEREKSFSRRALLQWSLPAAAAAIRRTLALGSEGRLHGPH